jgi:hypothetical protein
MRHFTPDSSRRKNNREKRLATLNRKFEAQRNEFDVNSSRPYRIVNTTFLSLSIHPFKHDFMQSFMVLLNKPLRKSEVTARMERAFGDLEC